MGLHLQCDQKAKGRQRLRVSRQKGRDHDRSVHGCVRSPSYPDVPQVCFMLYTVEDMINGHH